MTREVFVYIYFFRPDEEFMGHETLSIIEAQMKYLCEYKIGILACILESGNSLILSLNGDDIPDINDLPWVE